LKLLGGRPFEVSFLCLLIFICLLSLTVGELHHFRVAGDCKVELRFTLKNIFDNCVPWLG
jgi:hypothetical protein